MALDVHHLNCGTMRVPLARLFNGSGGLFRRGRLVCHCLLIETEAGLVLVDTGFSLADFAHPSRQLGFGVASAYGLTLDPAETAIRHIEALGFTAADVRHIILTHLDFDHSSGLADFPKAKVHVHADELAVALHPKGLIERQRYTGQPWAHGPDWVSYQTPASGEDWFGFTAVRELEGLPPEILAIPLPGHTKGQWGVVVDTGRTTGPRWLLHAGDSHDDRRQRLQPPYCPPLLRGMQRLLAPDLAAQDHNIARLGELAKNPDVDIVCAHDPVDFDQHQHATMTG